MTTVLVGVGAFIVGGWLGACALALCIAARGADEVRERGAAREGGHLAELRLTVRGPYAGLLERIPEARASLARAIGAVMTDVMGRALDTTTRTRYAITVDVLEAGEDGA